MFSHSDTSREGRSCGPLVRDPATGFWREAEPSTRRASRAAARGPRARVWTEADRLLCILLALRSKEVRGLTGRVRRAAGFTAAQASMGRSSALDALGLPHGFGSDGGLYRHLLKTYGAAECEARAWRILTDLDIEPSRDAVEYARRHGRVAE